MFTTKETFTTTFNDPFFNSVFDALESNNLTSYPPYNIGQISETGETVLQIAATGFSKDEIEVEHDPDKNTLEITATKSNVEPKLIFTKKGLAFRNWKQNFKLARWTEISQVNLENGLLEIVLKSNRPDDLKIKKIEIQ